MPMLSDIVYNLHMTNAVIDCYYVNDSVLDECIEKTKDGFVRLVEMEVILSSHKPHYRYFYKGITNELNLIGVWEQVQIINPLSVAIPTDIC